MATVVNNPGYTAESNNSSALMIGAVLLILAILAFALLGRGALNFGGSSAPGVSVPERVDVNVNTPQ